MSKLLYSSLIKKYKVSDFDLQHIDNQRQHKIFQDNEWKYLSFCYVSILYSIYNSRMKLLPQRTRCQKRPQDRRFRL